MPTVKFAKSTVNPIGYVQTTPDGIDKTKRYPLVIFLHGDGGKGDGSLTDLEKLSIGELPKELQVKAHAYNFIILAPQMNAGWTKEINHVSKMLEIAAFLPVDNTKVYLTGISRGGEGVWGWPSWSAENARKLAALIPVCAVPGRDIGSYCNIGQVPIWAFHAKDDGHVGIKYTIDTIAAIERCIGHKPVIATYFETGLHWIWGRVYGEDTLYNWMLAKSNDPMAAPVLTEFKVDAGADFTTSSPVFKLNATAKGKWDRAKWTMVSQPDGVNKYANVIKTGGGWIIAEGVLPKPGKYRFEIEISANLEGHYRTAADVIEITYEPSLPERTPKIEIDLRGKTVNGVKVYEDWSYELN